MSSPPAPNARVSNSRSKLKYSWKFKPETPSKHVEEREDRKHFEQSFVFIHLYALFPNVPFPLVSFRNVLCS